MERALAGQGLKPPAEVYAARDRLEVQIKESGTAMSGANAGQSDRVIQSMEDTVLVIERYLKLK
jgi:hypothetical protein